MDNFKILDEQQICDEFFIRAALKEAQKAALLGEVPIGAVIVAEQKIIASGHNLRETTADPTAHAEMVVLRAAAAIKGHWRLTEMTLYCTLEPCPMCAGALVQARVGRLVYGAYDLKAGAAGTLMNLVQDSRLNHRMKVTSGVLENECAEVLQTFFRKRR